MSSQNLEVVEPMLEDHPTFKPPKDENTTIWRYMDFTKFVSLLSTRSLFFARSDRLGDPFEGSWPANNLAARRELFTSMGFTSDAASIVGRLARSLPKFVAVNCWHMNEAESAAMWRLYLKSDEGIAIRSTVGRLKSAFAPGWPDKIWVGQVTYIDYQRDAIPEGNLLNPFVHKRSSFGHEHELRAVLARFPTPVRADYLETLETERPICPGVSVPVDLSQLIENVVVAPTTPDWYLELVQDVLKRYDCSAGASRSNLDCDPVY
jgi:hypothetical protein